MNPHNHFCPHSRATRASISGAAGLLSLTLALACNTNKAPDHKGAAPSASAPVALSHAAQLDRTERAKKLFLAECAGCHGEYGRGDGPAAATLAIKPRNFLREKFKVRSTQSGDAPTQKDIYATITRGMPGSAMPSFKFLSDEERTLLSEHVWSLAGLSAKRPGKVVAMTPEPPSDQSSIQRGRALYEKLACGQCHGAEGRADGPSAKTLKDDFERPIAARDLTREMNRGGDDAAAIQERFRTGMDGTPMPTFSDNLNPVEGWDLAHYVASMRAPKEALPSDPLAAGRRVIEEKQCNGCHVIEGRGGRVGPSLDIAAAKLRYDWARDFLGAPRKAGKIYPYTPYRMPDLGLTPKEIDGVLAVFANTAHRTYPEPPAAAVHVDDSKVAAGQLTYFLKCTECHNMGNVIPTPEAKRQGPDLIDVSRRMEFDWIATWVKNPREIYPDARMVDTNLTAEQIEEVRAFIWKTSVEAKKAEATASK
jgi:cytochrome c oxidase cbb3-type subunit 2